MGRMRQKAKNRSSTPKVKHKPKSKKKLLHNPIIAANWNQKETLAQNYKRLGLASRLRHRAGGTEKIHSELRDSEDEEGPDTADALDVRRKIPTTLDVTEVRVERDPETGAILTVNDDQISKSNPLNDPLNDLTDSEGEGWQGFVNEHGLLDGVDQQQDATTDTVRALQQAASRPAAKRERKQSEREQEWVSRLVDKHGDDYRAMSRDLKLNAMQQSEGDIKRRIKKWKAAQA